MRRLIKKSEKSTKTEVSFIEKDNNWSAKKIITEEEVFPTEEEANSWLNTIPEVPQEGNLEPTNALPINDQPQLTKPVSLRDRLQKVQSKLNKKYE